MLPRPPVVSVVTPSFNQGPYIGDTVRSVLAQEGAFYLDYIVFDGGSVDESTTVLRAFEELLRCNCDVVVHSGLPFYRARSGDFGYARCLGVSYRWVSEPDGGQVDALKRGFAIAIGDIFAWINSDDFYTGAGVLATVVTEFARDAGLELLTGDGTFVDRAGTAIGVHHVDRVNYRELLYLDYHILQPSTFFRARIYQPARLQDKYICAFDADFFINLLSSGVQFKKIDDRLSAFRIYPEIKTNALATTRFREQMAIAWAKSKNVPFYLISALHRTFEIVLRRRFGGYRSFQWVARLVSAAAYLAITGKPGR